MQAINRSLKTLGRGTTLDTRVVPATAATGNSFLIEAPSGGIPPMEDRKAGSAECIAYYLEDDGSLVALGGPITVFNVGKESIKAGEIKTATLTGLRAIVSAGVAKSDEDICDAVVRCRDYILELWYICQYICEHCDGYARPDYCYPDCGTCHWILQEISVDEWEWQLDRDLSDCTQACYCKTPPEIPSSPSSGLTATTKCEEIECGSCTWDWDDTNQVWTATGTPGCTGDCECQPPPWDGAEGDLGISYPCLSNPPPPACCTDCTPGTDFFINELAAQVGPGASYAMDDPQLQEKVGDCTVQVPITWSTSPPEPVDSFPGMATVTYTGTTFTISVTNNPLDEGIYPGDWESDICACEANVGDNGATQISANIVTSEVPCVDPPLLISAVHPFRRAHPDLFTSCGCAGDLEPVFRRWDQDPDQITDRQFTNVARTLASKNSRVSVATIKLLLQQFWSRP